MSRSVETSVSKRINARLESHKKKLFVVLSSFLSSDAGKALSPGQKQRLTDFVHKYSKKLTKVSAQVLRENVLETTEQHEVVADDGLAVPTSIIVGWIGALDTVLSGRREAVHRILIQMVFAEVMFPDLTRTEFFQIESELRDAKSSGMFSSLIEYHRLVGWLQAAWAMPQYYAVLADVQARRSQQVISE